MPGGARRGRGGLQVLALPRLLVRSSRACRPPGPRRASRSGASPQHPGGPADGRRPGRSGRVSLLHDARSPRLLRQRSRLSQQLTRRGACPVTSRFARRVHGARNFGPTRKVDRRFPAPSSFHRAMFSFRRAVSPPSSPLSANVPSPSPARCGGRAELAPRFCGICCRGSRCALQRLRPVAKRRAFFRPPSAIGGVSEPPPVQNSLPIVVRMTLKAKPHRLGCWGHPFR